MNIKKYTANSTKEAIQMVKKEMGPDAVILKTRTLNGQQGRVGGKGPRIEVTAAVDYEAPVGIPDESNRLRLESVLQKWDFLEAELRDIKEVLLSAEAASALLPDLSYDKAVNTRYINFRAFGLRPDIIRGLMRECHEKGADGLQTESHFLRDSLSSVLARINTAREVKKKDKASIYAFIGPTGVGKTTTLAKLAAVKAVKQGKKAALITVDTFRVAAVSQLQTYARIMGIPLEVASGKKDLAKAISDHRDCDLILIDTAGRSPNRGGDMEELKDLFSVAETIHHYLVLSATTEYKELLHSDDRFGALPFKSYIFTKLDEVRDASSMINFLIARPKPVSYFTTGQQVPEDIEVASRKRLASLILARMRARVENPTDEVRIYGSSCRA